MPPAAVEGDGVARTGQGVLARGRPARRFWIGILPVLGWGAGAARADLPANPPPVSIGKPVVPGINAPHALDRSVIAPRDMRPPTAPVGSTGSDAPAPDSNSDLLAALRKGNRRSESYPEASPALIVNLGTMARAQSLPLRKLLGTIGLDPGDRQVLQSLWKIDFAALKPRAVGITAGTKLRVLTCPANPGVGLKFGDLVGVRDERTQEQLAVLGVAGSSSEPLQIVDAEPLIGATFVSPGNRQRAAENTLASLRFERIEPVGEFAPDALHYEWSGSKAQVDPPYPRSHELPRYGVGLVLFRPGTGAEVSANLVPPGYYAFRFDTREQRWGLVRRTFRATIDNTGRPAPFRFVLVDTGKEIVVPPLEVVTFAEMQPGFEITYRRNGSASLPPITETLNAGVWRVVSDPEGDLVRLEEDPRAGRDLVDIKGPDRVIFRNPEGSGSPATLNLLRQDPKTDKLERFRRILDPGEWTYVVARRYHTVNGAITNPSVLVEPPGSPPATGPAVPVYYEPGVHHADATAASLWSSPTKPDEFAARVFPPGSASFHFVDRTGRREAARASGPAARAEVRQPIPIAIEYDPGDGQGKVRQPLDSSNSKDSPPGHVVELDPSTSLLRLKRGEPANAPGVWEGLGRWLDRWTRSPVGK